MQPIAPPAPRHKPTGELIHNDDFPVFHHIFHVPAIEDMRLQRFNDMVHHIEMPEIIEIFQSQQLFNVGIPFFG